MHYYVKERLVACVACERHVRCVLCVLALAAKQTSSLTRSQAVARIADRTASQRLWWSRDVIGHVTIR